MRRFAALAYSVLLRNRYVWSVLVAGSIMLNAVTGGQAPQTLCYRAGTAKNAGRRWGCVFCRVLDYFDPGHCDTEVRRWNLVKRFL
jgi:hypothetical protein